MNAPHTSLIWTALAVITATGLTLSATELDDRIEDAFGKSYVSKVCLKEDAVKIESRNGVATLTGTVSVSSHKYLAGEAVANLPGVTRVDNRLEVHLEGSEKSDNWIRAKVRSILALHRDVSGSDTLVDIQDGVIILRGTASSKAQRDLATEHAGDVQGVVRVTNLMAIAPPPTKPAPSPGPESVDDASITAQVKAALQLHHSTSSISTRVATLAGVVTVDGVAQNLTEKTRVAKLATDIPGVKAVLNKMTLSPGRPAIGVPPRPVTNLRIGISPE